MTEVPTVEPISYEEFQSRYEEGKFVTPHVALDKSYEFQDEMLEESSAFGSITANSEIYGERKLDRPTDQTLDFVTYIDRMKELVEEHDAELWSPETESNCYFMDFDGYGIGLVPVEREVFNSDVFESPITIPEEEMENSRTVETSSGELNVSSPELNFATKARRYAESRLADKYVKSNDLADLASIMLRNNRDNIYNDEELASRISEYTNGIMPFNDFKNEMQVRADEHINVEDWRVIDEEIDSLEELYNDAKDRKSFLS